MLARESYLIDTNSLITPKATYYPMDLVPRFWQSMAEKIEDGSIDEEGLGKKYHLDIRATIERTKADSKRMGQLIQEKEERGEDVSVLTADHARIEGMLRMLNRFWTSDIFLNPWLNENWELEFLNHAR